jgi:polyhydroxyalkanoate synthesis regulator phasin
VTLYENRIVTPDGEAELSHEVRADVDTAGNLAVSTRVTATRLVTIGIFAFAFKKKKKHDTRELHLVVETPEFMTVRQIDANLGAKARSFVAQIMTAARQAEGNAETKRHAVEAAKGERSRIEQDTSAIDSAWRELEAAEADRQEIERLREEVARLTPRSPA